MLWDGDRIFHFTTKRHATETDFSTSLRHTMGRRSNAMGRISLFPLCYGMSCNGDGFFPLRYGMPWDGDRFFHFPTPSYWTEVGNFHNASVYHRQTTISNILLRSDLLCCTHQWMVFHTDDTS
jgi:hypothetical protein